MTGEKVRFKAPPPVADINVTPMVDVMLVLLIIFMVITPMLSKGVSVTLVQTQHPIAMQAADKSDAIVCAVTRNGDTFLGTTKTCGWQGFPRPNPVLAISLERVIGFSPCQ